MSIGARLYNLRVDSKLSRAELAEKFGVARNTVFRWEQNKFAPKRSILVKLADYYGVSVDWILKGIGTEESPLERRLNIPNLRPETLIAGTGGLFPKVSEDGMSEDRPDLAGASEGADGGTGCGSEKAAVKYLFVVPDEIISAGVDKLTGQERIAVLFGMLSEYRRGRLLGYLDALCSEELSERQPQQKRTGAE